MYLLKVYLWMFQIALASFGGAYSIWALLISEAGMECETTGIKPAEGINTPIIACRDDLQKIMGFSELLPEPQVNAIAMTAYADYGIPGMLAMVLGLITPGLVLIPILLRLLQRSFALPWVKAFFAGAGIATTAILAHFAFFLLKPAWVSLGLHSLLSVTCCLVAMALSLRCKLNAGLIVILGGIFGYCFL